MTAVSAARSLTGSSQAPVKTACTSAFGFTDCAPSAKALTVQLTRPIGCAVTKPRCPDLDIAPATMPQILTLIAATVDRPEIGAVLRARHVDEGDLRILLGEFLEGVGIAERAAEDNVVAALDITLRGRFDLGGIIGDALDKRNGGVELLFHFHARFIDRLLPAAVILGIEIDPGDFRRALKRKGTGRRPRERQHGAGDNERSSQHFRSPRRSAGDRHCPAPRALWIRGRGA